jgi:hypothetical protein
MNQAGEHNIWNKFNFIAPIFWYLLDQPLLPRVKKVVNSMQAIPSGIPKPREAVGYGATKEMLDRVILFEERFELVTLRKEIAIITMQQIAPRLHIQLESRSFTLL